MKSKKSLFSIMLIIVLVFCTIPVTFTGCTSGKKNKLQVGVVLPTKDESRWLQDQAQFEKILGDAGLDYQITFSQGSSATEKTNVETLISKGIKVLIICPQDGASAASTVQQAKDADVKVIAYDRLINDTDALDYYITFDSIAVGKAQGQFLIDNAPEGKTDIPLYLYAGSADDNNAYLFFQGAWEVLQPKIADGTFKIANSDKAEAVKDKTTLSREELGGIIGQVTTDWKGDIAKSKAESHLTAVDASQKGEVLVLAPNDDTSRSIADVFKSDKDITKYTITGQDAEKASIEYIIDGTQSMTVFKNTNVLATDACNMAKAILDGEDVQTDTTYDNGTVEVPSKQSPIEVVTKDTVKKALIDSGYYKESDISNIGKLN